MSAYETDDERKLKKEQRIKNLSLVLVCPECGATRERLASGIACPNGHGGITQCTNAELNKARRLAMANETPQQSSK